jgi:hypothetical protein
MLNKPTFFLFIHSAACSAPSAKSSLEKAVCFNSMFSILLLKSTECFPIVLPFLVIKKLTLFFCKLPFLFKNNFPFIDYKFLLYPSLLPRIGGTVKEGSSTSSLVYCQSIGTCKENKG